MARALAERIAYAVAVVALGVWGLTWVSGHAGTQRELDRFQALRQARPGSQIPDFALWSPARIEAWRALQAESGPPPMGVLRIPRLRVEAPILEGTDDATLNRAVGHIDGTVAPGAIGNSGIAGHRDSFFRALKDITTGDTIELETTQETQLYRVEQTWIVTPDDVWVLDPTPSQAVTLVTCHPFYFIGPAPKRFIVRAVRRSGT